MRKKPRLANIFTIFFLNNKTYALSNKKDPPKKSLESFELQLEALLCL